MIKLSLIFTLLLSGIQLAQNVSGNVTGLPQNIPLEGVYITVKDNSTGDLLGTDTTDSNGNYSIDYIIIGVQGESSLPNEYYLSNPYPQPFNPSTRFEFATPVSGNFGISIYTILGERLFNEQIELDAGSHSFLLSGFGSAGVYLFNISSNDFSATRKLLLLDGGEGNIKLEHFKSSGTLHKRFSITDLLISFLKEGYYNKDTVVRWTMNLIVDAKLQQVTEYRTITLEAFVPMSGYNQPLIFYTARLKTTQGSILQTKLSGNTNTVTFSDVASPAIYLIEIFRDTASRPNINAKDTTIYLIGDTAIVVNPQLQLRPAVLSNLEDKIFNEDEYPAEPRLHDLFTKATGYDSLGNQVNPSALLYLIQSQSNPNLAPVIIEANQYTKLDALLPDGNGTNNVTVRAIAPNSLYADKGFNVVVAAQPDRKGQLKDTEGNARQGWIYARNAAGQQFIMQTNADGTFAYQLQPSAWDSLKGQIQNDVRPNEGGFIRALYFTSNNDQNNINVDAVPHLNGADYIGLDTLDSFIKEANFEAPIFPNTLGKLKKADLNNMLDFISSWTTFYQDTIKPDEQNYIRNIISQRIDPYFDQPSAKWSVPQDSGISSPRNNAITWVKNNEGPLGSIATFDQNGDGILEKAWIGLSYIRNIVGQDTTYNNKGIVQEGLSGRVAPGEVGIVSPIAPYKTVLHMNTPQRFLQPADKWLVDIAKNYPVLTEHDAILKIGNLATMYNKALQNKGKGPIIIANKYANVED